VVQYQLRPLDDQYLKVDLAGLVNGGLPALPGLTSHVSLLVPNDNGVVNLKAEKSPWFRSVADAGASLVRLGCLHLKLRNIQTIRY